MIIIETFERTIVKGHAGSGHIAISDAYRRQKL